MINSAWFIFLFPKLNLAVAFITLLIVSIRLSYMEVYVLFKNINSSKWYDYDDNIDLHCAKCFTHIIQLDPLNNPIKLDIIISSSQIYFWKAKVQRNEELTQENGVRTCQSKDSNPLSKSDSGSRKWVRNYVLHVCFSFPRPYLVQRLHSGTLWSF